ncbi:hypothetical protein H920_06893 [Fukomys damarensis]|uniref:Uncharacterized protein n=1 Tax=Fukomys damarensis TaxID=885580 RepID=A0A091DHY7_FUKDA|nr:hypothetical protein H920_06893 [Fukomys damarensis]
MPHHNLGLGQEPCPLALGAAPSVLPQETLSLQHSAENPGGQITAPLLPRQLPPSESRAVQSEESQEWELTIPGPQEQPKFREHLGSQNDS